MSYRGRIRNGVVVLDPPDPASWDAGRLRYAERPDKGGSLTDCLSFVVME